MSVSRISRKRFRVRRLAKFPRHLARAKTEPIKKNMEWIQTIGHMQILIYFDLHCERGLLALAEETLSSFRMQQLLKKFNSDER